MHTGICAGSEAAARVASEAMTADMAAFKAANPGAELVDFLRWYSPGDVAVDAQVIAPRVGLL